MAKNFWFKFYFKDWADDVKPLSLNARGLLIELIIHLNKTEGIMECNINDIIRLTGGLTHEITGGLDEFRKHKTFDFEKVGEVEYIKSRKILKQLELQAINKENGKKGGNPRLKGLTEPDKREDNPTPNSNSIFDSNNINTTNNGETPQTLPTKTGEENPYAKKDKKSLPKPATKPFQSAEHWRKRLTEEHKLSFRRMLLAKFRNTPDDQLNYAMFLYLDWWNLKHPEGETFKTFTSWFSYYVSDMKDLPKTPDKIKML